MTDSPTITRARELRRGASFPDNLEGVGRVIDDADATRDAVLAREGFRTLRILATDVTNNLEGVGRVIDDALLPHPHPDPFHKREGEGTTRPSEPAHRPPPPRGEGWGGGRAQAAPPREEER